MYFLCISKYILKANIILCNGPLGAFETSPFEQSSVDVENLIKERNLARQSGNFELADEIRGKLEIKGVILEDKGDNTTWKIKNEG